ncbi:prepilin-type N-terminal cleavage/methylation domain-containing protein [Paraglaciecola sp.]|uniref:pilus assembly FimT family protein n=1 Tax=Paraglaciecola sp. TaxID=1920173 RepID=UPI0030F4932A
MKFIFSDRKYAKGFTLIELLVVISIMGALMSIVGPMTIDSISKAQARSEALTLKSWIRYQSQRAFISGIDVQLQFDGQQIISDNLDILPKQFEYLSFQPQIIRLTKHGFIQPQSISAKLVEKEIMIEFDNGKKSV